MFKKGDYALVTDQDWGFYHGINDELVMIETMIRDNINPKDRMYMVKVLKNQFHFENLYAREMKLLTEEEAMLWILSH